MKKSLLKTVSNEEGAHSDPQQTEGDAIQVKSILIYDKFILNRMAYMKMDPRIIRNGNRFLMIVVMLIGFNIDYCQ